jgi:hypothetical protein
MILSITVNQVWRLMEENEFKIQLQMEISKDVLQFKLTLYIQEKRN